jgi:hypothetical protein
MPIIYMDPMKAEQVPSQRVFVGTAFDPTLVCQTVQVTNQATTAQFRAPTLRFDTDKLNYYKSEVTVYADEFDGQGGYPVFRGVMDGGKSKLRGEFVTFPGRSLLSYLRSRSTCLRNGLRLPADLGVAQNTTRTFAGPFKESFLEYDPYVVFKRQYTEWQPWDILSWYVENRLEPWFADRIKFYFDPDLSKLATRRVSLARWVVDDSGEPVLEVQEIAKSPIGDQVFRLVTWGHVLDFVAQLIPGVQMFEQFTDAGAECWFMYPWRGGIVPVTIGKEGIDCRTAGATVNELENDVSNADLINRLVVVGLPASCTVTLLSETLDEEDASQNLGLVPDWPVYDLDADDLGEEKPLVGFGFDYEANDYLHSTVVPQAITKMLAANNPEIGIPGNPDFVPGLEWVGRRWRLPNWFTFANMERGGDMFLDPRTGDVVNFQVFVESIKVTDAGDFYDWQRWPYGVEVDWKHKRIVFAEAPFTNYLKLQTTGPKTGLYVTDHSRGPKLCRVALTFTYSIDNFVPYADTYLKTLGVIDPSMLTAITPGQPLLFQRIDLGFSQITNIGMPLFRHYSETIPLSREDATANENQVFQTKLEDESPLEYSDLIVHAEVGLSELTRTFLDVTDTPHTLATDGPFTEAQVIRDDTPQLHSVAQEMLSYFARRPRRMSCALGHFSKAPARGNSAVFLNLAAGGGTGMDMIDSVSHDLERGQTAFTTNNQITNLDFFTTSQDTEISYA